MKMGLAVWGVVCMLGLSGCGADDKAPASGPTPDAGTGAPDSAVTPGGDDAQGAGGSDAGGGDARGQDASNPADAAQPDVGPPAVAGPPIGELLGEVASTTCAALARCCDEGSVTRYFDVLRNNDRFVAFRDRMPPSAPFEEASCAALLEEAFAVAPFGKWIAAVDEGLVRYDQDAAGTCLAELAGATCGADLADALYDSSCFGFSPPAGGEFQRSMFARTTGEGGGCMALNDGIGGVLFGTCDPSQAFCCYPREGGAPGCGYSSADGRGTCKAASPVGESCSALPGQLQLCATGTDCGEGDRCEAPNLTPLAVGATCVGEDFAILGECQQSWCDVFGSSKCEAPRANGETCRGGGECASGDCLEGQCVAFSFCLGR